MTSKFSVLVQIDLHGRHVTLAVTGTLTETNQQALHPLIRRARTLGPDVTINVDLTGAQDVAAPAVDLLRWEVEQEETTEGPVRYLLPRDRMPVGTGPGAHPRRDPGRAA